MLWALGPTRFLYCTHSCTTLLLVLHSYASYIKTFMYILSFEKYNIIAFSISNMVLEPLLWHFLSSTMFRYKFFLNNFVLNALHMMFAFGGKWANALFGQNKQRFALFLKLISKISLFYNLILLKSSYLKNSIIL